MGTTLAKRVARFFFRHGYSNPVEDPRARQGLLGRSRTVAMKGWRALEVLRGVYFDRRFDRKHGVDTSGAIHLRELDIDNANVQDGVLYDPFPHRSFKEVMRRLPSDVTEHTFVDYGSGKGRLLLAASDYPFKRIVGVEFAKDLHEVAARNIERYRGRRQRCTDLVSLHADATEYEPPGGPCVFFMFTPFGGRVLETVLGRIRASYLAAPRDLRIFFVTDARTHPVPFDVFERAGGMVPSEEGLLPFDAARRYPVQYVVFVPREETTGREEGRDATRAR